MTMHANAFTAGVVLASLLGTFVAVGGPARAADLGNPAPAFATEGVDCQGDEVKGFPSVWLGHFTGGEMQYSGPGGAEFLDWRDEHLCFPSRRSCDRWITGLRRDYHRPEGYFTCLTIR